MEVAAEIDEDFLFERIIDPNTQRVERVAQEIAESKSADAPDEEIASVGGDDVIDDPFDDLRNRDEEEGAADGEREGEREESAVAEQVAGDASEGVFGLSRWQGDLRWAGCRGTQLGDSIE